MNNFRLLLILSMIAVFPDIILPQAVPEKAGEYLKKTYESETGTLNYQILYPHDFDESKAYPLLLFLHGSGERGTDNEAQMKHGSWLFLDSLSKYPAVVIFPQCPQSDYWANLERPDQGGRSRDFTFNTKDPPNPSLAMVIELMDTMIEKPFIDPDRVYLAGLSMGGMGVWELLWRMPGKVAAAIPICGGGPPEKAAVMKDVPIWIFHGMKDEVVHPRYSISMLKAIQREGGIAKISLYPDVNHNSWDFAFAEPQFLSWLFSKSKK